jgi:hypothetical protein
MTLLPLLHDQPPTLFVAQIKLRHGRDFWLPITPYVYLWSDDPNARKLQQAP